MSLFKNAILLFTVLFSGLVAGLFYSYSCSVNPGLNALDDEAYLLAMQSINRAIQNPVFFIAFMGLLLLYPLSCVFLYQNKSAFRLMISATFIYYILVFGVTSFGNVPLNNRLEDLVFSMADKELLSSFRNIFEEPWNNFHSVRTVASVFSFLLSIVAVMQRKSVLKP